MAPEITKLWGVKKEKIKRQPVKSRACKRSRRFTVQMGYMYIYIYIIVQMGFMFAFCAFGIF